MIVFKNISGNKTFIRLSEAAELFQPSLDVNTSKSKISKLIEDAASDILEEAERYSLKGNLWHTFLALRLCEDENVLGRAAEFGGTPSESIIKIAAHELNVLCEVILKIQHMVESDKSLALLEPLSCYIPSRQNANARGVTTLVDELADRIFTAVSKSEPQQALASLVSFYNTHGSGAFALNRAFKWQAGTRGKNGRLVPISDLEELSLSALVGYEEQKNELLANTEQFLSGKAANNVLLFGDSGTGKSSSIKALLNEPGFTRRGLRMIEVYKEQYRDIADILNFIRSRNYRFILFMDDLSFEEFEVEYKYLKAVLEGDLERKPDNVVIYATSNRRNLIREVWKDRKMASDDVHGWDTMQEKHSLAARFGVTIWYGAADKDLYLKMIETMAREGKLSIPKDELERMALQWEVGRGGYTGRTAKQFIQYALRLT